MSNATLQLLSPNVAAETQLLPSYKGAHALAVLSGCLSYGVIQAHAVREPKILLMFCMQPAAITLNYSIKNTPNDICQIIYEKLQFSSLVWGLLTLPPISITSLRVLVLPIDVSGHPKTITLQLYIYIYTVL